MRIYVLRRERLSSNLYYEVCRQQKKYCEDPYIGIYTSFHAFEVVWNSSDSTLNAENYIIKVEK